LKFVSEDNSIDTPLFPARRKMFLLRKSLIKKVFTDTPCFFQKSAEGGVSIALSPDNHHITLICIFLAFPKSKNDF